MSKHINYQDTKIIEENLDSGVSLNEISISVSKDPRAVSRHIAKYKKLYSTKKYRNSCGNQENCFVKHLCDNCPNGKCKYCSFKNCNELNCSEYSKTPVCKKLEKFPFVCNACVNLSSCKLPKFIYDHNYAYDAMRENLILSRSHLHKNKAELSLIDSIVTPLVLNKISLEVIVATHPELGLSLSTLYSYISKGLFSIKNIDLLRKVRYKTRKKQTVIEVTYDYLKGRCYEDFLAMVSKKSNLYIWELDTIEGIKGGKAVMSLLNRTCNLQLFFLINSIETSVIVDAFDQIKDKIGENIFKKYFQIILTDRGKEFKDPLGIELSPNGENLCKVYYCDARQSQQKGKCEKNHEHFRVYYPKGTSFDKKTQEEINSVSLRVNNYPRDLLNWKSPFDVATVLFDEKILDLNKLTKLAIEDFKK